MSLNATLTASFKNAALSIFESFVNSDEPLYVFAPRKIDPVTGTWNADDNVCNQIRGIITNIPLIRLDPTQNVEGKTVAYFLYDEVDFIIQPGSEIRQFLSSSVNLVNPNDDASPSVDTISAGTSTLAATDTIQAGTSSISAITSAVRKYESYSVEEVYIDPAEAVYTLTVRRK